MTERILPRQGVITLYGYGIRLSVDRGHLVTEDGVGPSRRWGRFARVGHGLRRVVVIGADGCVSLSALRWLVAQNSAFVLLERDGHVLATTSPLHSSDVHLRRLQATAKNSDVGLRLAARLIKQKLVGQENVARKRLKNQTVADRIAVYRSKLELSRRLESILSLEANAALEYWSAWSNLQIQFPRADLARVPDHWRIFGARISPLTKSPRLAVNPPNSVLNYLYCILQAEARLAAAQMGLDPELGVLHKDAPNRDSLACDLMEPVRPLVDSFVFDWLSSGPLRREWFFEEMNGNCRLMASFAAQLSETALTWRKAVAPYAEEAANIFWGERSKRLPDTCLPTRLTQTRRSQAKAGKLVGVVGTIPETKPRCPVCAKRQLFLASRCYVRLNGNANQHRSPLFGNSCYSTFSLFRPDERQTCPSQTAAREA